MKTIYFTSDEINDETMYSSLFFDKITDFEQELDYRINIIHEVVKLISERKLVFSAIENMTGGYITSSFLRHFPKSDISPAFHSSIIINQYEGYKYGKLFGTFVSAYHNALKSFVMTKQIFEQNPEINFIITTTGYTEEPEEHQTRYESYICIGYRPLEQEKITYAIYRINNKPLIKYMERYERMKYIKNKAFELAYEFLQNHF